MSKPDYVQIYVTDGKLGKHAGVYHSDRTWAAHPADAATAAYRAAIKFWFGKGHNSAWLYLNVSRVSIRRATENTFDATLAPAHESALAAKPKAKLKRVRPQTRSARTVTRRKQ